MNGVVAVSRDVLAKHGRTFWLASHFLPRTRRDDAAVVYAFCRMVDDIADEAEEGTSASDVDAALTEVERELTDAATPRPLVAAYREVCERLEIPLGAAHELIAGCRGDLDRVRLRGRRDVVRYSYRVAGTVGIMMCGVLGVRDREHAIAHAINLGVAMQLTNISRDVLADAEIDRVYLPGIATSEDERGAVEILASDPEEVAGATAALLELADEYYASARRGFRYIPMPGRIAIAVAAYVYRAIGMQVASRGFAYDAARAVVPPWRKLLWLLYGFVVACVPLRAHPHETALHVDLQGLTGADEGLPGRLPGGLLEAAQ